MGLDINAVQFLLAARQRGADFGEVVMLGRQDLNVFPVRMRKLLRGAGRSDELFRPEAPDTRYAEPVFKALGAKQVYSLDFSASEGASFVHDLNQPIGPELRERFDTVYDGGTLERLFARLLNAFKIGFGLLRSHSLANRKCFRPVKKP